MSMQYWVRDLARRLGDRFGIEHTLQNLSDDDIGPYLSQQLSSIPDQDFLSGVSIELLAEEAELESQEGDDEQIEE